MKEGSLKVVVAITEAYPTLLMAMRLLGEAHRSERLKILALVGLKIESGAAFIAAPSDERPIASIEKSTNAEVNNGDVKFAVVLNEAQPLLHADIKGTPTRLRAERLRSLATLGLQFEVGGLVAAESSTAGTKGGNSANRAGKEKLEYLSPSKPEVPLDLSGAEDQPDSLPVKVEKVEASSAIDQTKLEARDVNAVGKKVRSFAKLLGGD